MLDVLLFELFEEVFQTKIRQLPAVDAVWPLYELQLMTDPERIRHQRIRHRRDNPEGHRVKRRDRIALLHAPQQILHIPPRLRIFNIQRQMRALMIQLLLKLHFVHQRHPNVPRDLLVLKNVLELLVERAVLEEKDRKNRKRDFFLLLLRIVLEVAVHVFFEDLESRQDRLGSVFPDEGLAGFLVCVRKLSQD